MENLKKQSGITLVILMITVVVLAFLAIVSVQIMTDSDIIGQTKETTESYEKMANNEEQQYQQLKQEILGE